MTTHVAWTSPAGPDHKLVVTYGFDRYPENGGKIREAFCSGFRATSDICALANDACVLLSLLLQHGYGLEAISDKLGQEGEHHGPPSSLIGAIVRKGVEVEQGG